MKLELPAGYRDVAATPLLAIAVAIIFATGVCLQLRVHVWQDVSWITHSAAWLLEGRRFGSAIIDPNPPLIWFFSVPAAALVKFAQVSEPNAIRIYMWAVCALGVMLCYRLLRPVRAAGQKLEAAAIIVGLSVSIAILPAGSFAQREFLAFVLGAPYCLLVADRITYGSVLPRLLTVSIGVLAGIAFGFKPWLLAVPLALEVLHFVKHRTFGSFFRPETWGLAGTLLVYLLIVVVLTPDYFTVTLPLARATYWIYGRQESLQLWIPLSHALEPAVAAAILFALSRSIPAHAWALLASLAGFTCNYWFQYKGFDYHLYPVTGISVVLLIYAAAHLCRVLVTGKVFQQRWLRAAGVAIVAYFMAAQTWGATWYLLPWFDLNDKEHGQAGRERQALIDRVKDLTVGSRKRLYAFSTTIYPAFPTMSYVDADWVSASPCQFPLAAMRLRYRITDPQKLAGIDRAAAFERDRVRREFQVNVPDIVLVKEPGAPRPGDPGNFSFIDFYSADPQFKALWENYREVAGTGQVRIFVREHS
jgi:hypothetical protein